MNQTIRQAPFRSLLSVNPSITIYLIIVVAAFTAGSIGGAIFRDLRSHNEVINQNNLSIKEITVPNDGLLFKSEDGTPLVTIGKDSIGSYVQLLSSDGKPLIKLTNTHDRGGVIIGTRKGSSLYLLSQDEGGTITMIGRYGKEVIQLTSSSEDGGHITLSEGSKGDPAIEIGTGKNRIGSRGTINVLRSREGGTEWQAP